MNRRRFLGGALSAGVASTLLPGASPRAQAGEIRIDNFDLAASVYFDLVRARIQFRALLNTSYTPTDAEIRETVDRAVKVFVGGIEALSKS